MNVDLEQLIPRDWTPTQALDPYDFAQAVADVIWKRYERELVPLIVADMDRQYDLPFDDEIPF